MRGHTVASLPAPPLNPPEYPLNGRYELALRWTPGSVDRLLDAGCAWGYGTRHFTERGREVVGLDPEPGSTALFRRRYPHLRCVQCALEEVPLESDSFDVILVLDTLEHVRDERRCLGELYRLLKTGGILIVTMPHRGAFAFLDRDNLAPRVAGALRRCDPGAWRRLRRDFEAAPTPRQHHRHYSLRDLRRLLDDSPFCGRYAITDVLRSGLFLEALTMDLELVLNALAPRPRVRWLLGTLNRMAARDFWIPYGPLSYNLAVRLVKTR
jgi:SAM-dependent methyltransferase